MRTLVNCILLITTLSANAQGPRLWGMTGAFNQIEFGTIFSINLDGSDHQIEYVFSPTSGYDSHGGLCLAPNGKLYGATMYGGIHGHGTLFSFDPTTGQFEKIFDMDYGGQIGSSWCTPLLASDGYLYGAGASNMYRIDPATDEVAMLPSYDVKEAYVQTPDGIIYGTEVLGGFNGSFGTGLLYRFDPLTEQVEELHEFGPSDGQNPHGKLCLSNNGNLYGVTREGGITDDGVVFEFDPVTEQFTVVAHFGIAGGSKSWAGFISVGPDLFLNTTVKGGLNNDGTICSFQPSTGTLTALHSFDQDAFPFGGLMQASNGYIYGMTAFAGTGSGTIYRFDTVDYDVTVIFEFPGGLDGHTPYAELIEVGGGVGIDPVDDPSFAMSVHPNPAHSSAKLVLANNTHGPWTITLKDVLGNLIWRRDIDSHTEMLELPKVSGLYLLTAVGTEASGVTRIVVE